jgi:hypothetical protein
MNTKLILNYNALNGKSPLSVPDEIYSPIGIIVYPTNADYKNGTFTRYFVKKVNSHVCLETSKSETKIVDKKYYVSVEISWKLTGQLTSTTSQYGEKTVGVEEYNNKQIEIGSRVIPEIVDILKNKSQFYRGT